MKLLEILQKELKEFPEGMLYAVQDDDGVVKFGKHSKPKLWRSTGVWNRYESGNGPTIRGLELAEDWDSAIVTKDMWENDRVKQIIVNVGGLSVEEKQRVNEALAKITGVTELPIVPALARWLFAPASTGRNTVTWALPGSPATSTHTPQQVLEMAGMVKQGHVHADLMAQYAEDAQTTDKPWELWQAKDKYMDNVWINLDGDPIWHNFLSFRRKPKTHTVNGVDIPDLRFVPERGDRYYLADPTDLVFIFEYTSTNHSCDTMWAERGLCYEYTEAGKQAAILHAKAMLGIA